MPLIPAKCTQCGANIEVDETKEAGICQCCGTAFITEKAINNYNTHITNNFAGANINVVGIDTDNFLRLAKLDIEAGNYEKALERVDKVLEANSEIVEGWLLKMRIVAQSSSVTEFKLNEVVLCGHNAIKISSEDKKDEIEYKVYEYYIDFSNLLMLTAITMTKDVEMVKKAFAAAGVRLAAISTVQKNDLDVRSSIEKITTSSLKLKVQIPEEYIKNNNELQEKVKVLAEQYVEYCKADQERTKIYGLTPDDQSPGLSEMRQRNLSHIKKGLKEGVVDTNQIEPAKSSGCYIATCVYGSYDCPQVWTLRRFRDYTLDETWYGRAFIKCYYAIGPTLVKWFGETQWFRTFWKFKLDKLVADLNNRGVADTYYNDKY